MAIAVHDNLVVVDLADNDLLCPVFAVLLGEAMRMLPDETVRKIVCERLMAAHASSTAALHRRRMN